MWHIVILTQHAARRKSVARVFSHGLHEFRSQRRVAAELVGSVAVV
jgi:hypothetical protein